MAKEVSFNPGNVGANGTVNLPAWAGRIGRLLRAQLTTGSDGTAAAATVDLVPQAADTTAGGQIKLVSSNQVMIGNAATDGASRLFLQFAELGEEPVGSALA